MTMFAHNVEEALHNCFIKLSIYTLSSREELMMNQFTNIEEHNKYGLDMEFSVMPS